MLLMFSKASISSPNNVSFFKHSLSQLIYVPVGILLGGARLKIEADRLQLVAGAMFRD